MKKKLLVDLYFLKDIYRGFGQIALNYGNYFKESYKRDEAPYELFLLVPKKYIGVFGNEVQYVSANNFLTRHCKYMLPKFDVWHNLQYPSRFKPYSKETKYIYTVHDLNCFKVEYLKTRKVEIPIIEGWVKKMRVKLNFWRINKHINRADVIVGISKYTYGQIRKEFSAIDENKIGLIYNGVEKLTDKPKSKPNVEIKKPFFFYISAYRDKKNFHALLDMMKLMPEKTLYLAGNDNTAYGIRIKRRIKDEKITNVHTLGKISEEEKRWMYANCEAFLFPSEFEGFGLPLIEAMQFGKPVFSSKETSLAEIGDKYAYFWDNLEAEHMKKVIDDNLEEYYKNPQLADAEKEYADTFSYARHFQQYEKIYRELCR